MQQKNLYPFIQLSRTWETSLKRKSRDYTTLTFLRKKSDMFVFLLKRHIFTFLGVLFDVLQVFVCFITHCI